MEISEETSNSYQIQPKLIHRDTFRSRSHHLHSEKMPVDFGSEGRMPPNR